ncbi:hypothetical protein JCM5350_005466 [Sporobolomyces pararoseus]
MAEVPRLQIDHELKAVAPALSPSSSYIGNHIFSPLISKVRQLSPFSQGIQVETSSIFPQHALRPDAPWITFLDKRNDLLDAYHLLYPSDKIDTTLTDDELRQAFVQFSLSLDSITTPHEWWSELPREAICDEESHSKLLQILDELVTLLRTVVRTESEVEEKRRITDKLNEGDLWLQELERWSRANGVASSSSKMDSWPTNLALAFLASRL